MKNIFKINDFFSSSLHPLNNEVYMNISLINQNCFCIRFQFVAKESSLDFIHVSYPGTKFVDLGKSVFYSVIQFQIFRDQKDQ